ncbi:MAG: hypothetical protein ABSF26_25255 [Thermoguttaceae bacterium]
MKEIGELRRWQIEAMQRGRSAQYFICQAPGGSGKSLIQVMLGTADIQENGYKQLVLVPQSHIHHSFFDEDRIRFTLPGDNAPSDWMVACNLCENGRQNVVDRLRSWLLADAQEVKDSGCLAAISTHAALVACWSRLSPKEKHQALSRITFRIDEAHHISNVFHEADIGNAMREAASQEATRLGQFVADLLTADRPSVKIHLTSATFFRGDRRTILSKSFKDRFVEYYLPWDEHFATLGIENLRMEFVSYDDNPIQQVVTAIAVEPKEKHLVIVPSLRQRYRTQRAVHDLLEHLYTVCPPNAVLDLVTPELQERNKELLFQQPDRFPVVVACRLFDEGTDWVPCSRLHNTAAGERSVTLAIQRIFRALRQHPNKHTVRILNYLPRFGPHMTSERQREVISDRLNALLACMLTQAELMPTLLPTTAHNEAEKPQRFSLQEIYGHRYRDVLTDLLTGYEAIENKDDSEAIARMVRKVIDAHGVPAAVDGADLEAAMLLQVVRLSRPKPVEINEATITPDVENLENIRLSGFDKVWEKGAGSTLAWESDNITPTTMRELLSVIQQAPMLSQIHAAIRSYYKRTGERVQVSTRSRSRQFEELGRSIQSVDHICRRHYNTSLAKEVVAVLGRSIALEQAHKVIRLYSQRDIIVNRNTGDLPEIGMDALTLDNRLRFHHNTTLRKEVEELLGERKKPLLLSTVREVIADYYQRGDSFRHRHFHIPELDMSNSNLRLRLRNDFGVELNDLIEEVQASQA